MNSHPEHTVRLNEDFMRAAVQKYFATFLGPRGPRVESVRQLGPSVFEVKLGPRKP
jgi:hypothetical protein